MSTTSPQNLYNQVKTKAIQVLAKLYAAPINLAAKVASVMASKAANESYAVRPVAGGGYAMPSDYSIPAPTFKFIFNNQEVETFRRLTDGYVSGAVQFDVAIKESVREAIRHFNTFTFHFQLCVGDTCKVFAPDRSQFTHGEILTSGSVVYADVPADFDPQEPCRVVAGGPSATMDISLEEEFPESAASGVVQVQIIYGRACYLSVNGYVCAPGYTLKILNTGNTTVRIGGIALSEIEVPTGKVRLIMAAETFLLILDATPQP